LINPFAFTLRALGRSHIRTERTSVILFRDARFQLNSRIPRLTSGSIRLHVLRRAERGGRAPPPPRTHPDDAAANRARHRGGWGTAETTPLLFPRLRNTRSAVTATFSAFEATISSQGSRQRCRLPLAALHPQTRDIEPWRPAVVFGTVARFCVQGISRDSHDREGLHWKRRVPPKAPCFACPFFPQGGRRPPRTPARRASRTRASEPEECHPSPHQERRIFRRTVANGLGRNGGREHCNSLHARHGQRSTTRRQRVTPLSRGIATISPHGMLVNGRCSQGTSLGTLFDSRFFSPFALQAEKTSQREPRRFEPAFGPPCGRVRKRRRTRPARRAGNGGDVATVCPWGPSVSER